MNLLAFLAGAVAMGLACLVMAVSALAWTFREIATKAQELAAKARLLPPGLRITGTDGKPTLELLASDPCFRDLVRVVVEATNRMRERARMQSAATGKEA